jgi:hypothetical protein
VTSQVCIGSTTPSSSEYAAAEEHPELAGTETADDIRGWIELLPS